MPLNGEVPIPRLVYLLRRDLAFRRQLDADDAAIIGRALAAAEALGLEAIEQPRHGAGIALRLPRQLGHCRGAAALKHEEGRPRRVGDALRLEAAICGQLPSLHVVQSLAPSVVSNGTK